jgi:hypothetical protein
VQYGTLLKKQNLRFSCCFKTVREGQRHLAQWTLQPIAALLAEEATAKLGGTVVEYCSADYTWLLPIP